MQIVDSKFKGQLCLKMFDVGQQKLGRGPDTSDRRLRRVAGGAIQLAKFQDWDTPCKPVAAKVMVSSLPSEAQTVNRGELFVGTAPAHGFTTHGGSFRIPFHSWM